MIDAFMIICQNIWETMTWAEEWTKSLIIKIPKKGNLRCYKNYITISRISHPSKIMLRIILNRLKGKAEKLLSEEQAGFRPKRSTTEHIFNIRPLIDKHVDHHQDLYHNFTDFKKAFDLVWHKRLWRVMQIYNIDERLVTLLESLHGPSTSEVLHEGLVTLLESLHGPSTSEVLHEGLVTLLESLHGPSTSAVLHEGLVTLLESLHGPSTSEVLHEGLVTLLESLHGPSTSAVLHEGLVTLLESLHGPSTSAVLQEREVGQSFRTSVGVRQGCLLSPVLFNLYLENTMQEALHNINGTISIDGREINKL